MSERWYFFNSLTDDSVVLQARMEGPGGMIGDATRSIKPHEQFRGLPYSVLKAADGGAVEIVNGKARIIDDGE